jgi:hypothetical protein
MARRWSRIDVAPVASSHFRPEVVSRAQGLPEVDGFGLLAPVSLAVSLISTPDDVQGPAGQRTIPVALVELKQGS